MTNQEREKFHSIIEKVAKTQGWDAGVELGFCRDFILKDPQTANRFVRYLRRKAKMEGKLEE